VQLREAIAYRNRLQAEMDALQASGTSLAEQAEELAAESVEAKRLRNDLSVVQTQVGNEKTASEAQNTALGWQCNMLEDEGAAAWPAVTRMVQKKTEQDAVRDG
jgi:acyl-homoserine lactone acylase PvdQ